MLFYTLFLEISLKFCIGSHVICEYTPIHDVYEVIVTWKHECFTLSCSLAVIPQPASNQVPYSLMPSISSIRVDWKESFIKSGEKGPKLTRRWLEGGMYNSSVGYSITFPYKTNSHAFLWTGVKSQAVRMSDLVPECEEKEG